MTSHRLCNLGGRQATAKLRLTFDEPGTSEGPYAEYYPEDSISADLLRLLASPDEGAQSKKGRRQLLFRL